MRNFLIILLIGLLNVNRIDAQNCDLRLKPIINFSICVGMQKKHALDLFEKVSKVKIGNEKSFTNRQFFEVEKEIVFQGRKIKISGNLAFNDSLLESIELRIPLEMNFESLKEIKSLIRENDFEGQNKFIYESKRTNILKRLECGTKLFIWSRDFNNPKKYSITYKIY